VIVFSATTGLPHQECIFQENILSICTNKCSRKQPVTSHGKAKFNSHIIAMYEIINGIKANAVCGEVYITV
jgi:hypothetical protein